jgi:hypothetical protein
MNDETLKMLSDVEQSGEFLTQNLPSLWWGLYNNSIKKGFTKEQALDLVKQYIRASLSNIKNRGDCNDWNN